MESLEEIRTYITILAESLEKKNLLLEQLSTYTVQQKRELSKETDIDMDVLESLIHQKEVRIAELTRLDQGFELIYDKVKEGIAVYKQELKELVLRVQGLIGEVTDKAVKLQALEIENKSRMEAFFSGKRSQIKTFKISSKTAANYYKNMSGHTQESSYFMDKKK